MQSIAYTRGYKYQLVETYRTEINIIPDQPVVTQYIELSENGDLTVRPGYAWDGPSGSTIDTLNLMRGSLIHDALYQLMRNGNLDSRVHRDPADRLLQRICREDGMSLLRAWWVYRRTSLFSDVAADPADKKMLMHAPQPVIIPCGKTV